MNERGELDACSPSATSTNHSPYRPATAVVKVKAIGCAAVVGQLTFPATCSGQSLRFLAVQRPGTGGSGWSAPRRAWAVGCRRPGTIPVDGNPALGGGTHVERMVGGRRRGAARSGTGRRCGDRG